jgi:hypothetical protein
MDEEVEHPVPESRFRDGRLLVVAFEGWNDAGEAASNAVRALKDHLDVYPVAEVDPEDYFDFQFSRPVTTTDDEGRRILVWPGVTLYGPTTPGDSSTHLLLGTEPSRSWRKFSAEILDHVRTLDITGVVFLGSMLADVPHTRPISVFASSDDAALRESFGLERSLYEGPVGILSALSVAAQEAGLPTMSIWASVPHYVHNSPSPKATLALLDKLEEMLGIDVPRAELAEEATAWEAGVNELAGEDEEMAAYIEQLEQARDTVDAPEASGEAIAQEFERYLRREDRRRGGDEPWRPNRDQ